MKKLIWGIALTCLLASNSLTAQSFNDKFQDIFQSALNTSLLGQGQSGRNFSPTNNQLSRRSIEAFTDFLGANVVHFPFGASATGLSFDFSNGLPATTTHSLGPIFSERATTLGKGRFNIGFLANYLNYQSARGLDLDDLRFTFTHNDVGQSGLGDSVAEWDRIELAMNMGVRATIFSFVGTIGISDRIDVGIAIPFISVKITSDPLASIISQTYLQTGIANFYYGGSESAPILSTAIPGINEEATGFGDLVFRGKFHFLKDNRMDLAGMLSVRLATGSKENFLGSGDGFIKMGIIGSTQYGSMTPHVNLFYQRQSGAGRGDEIALYLGYDHQVTRGLTLVVDLLGEYQIRAFAPENSFPETATFQQEVSNNVTYRRQIALSNLPQRTRDHYVNAAFGLKYSPREDMIILLNLLTPLNSGGLRTAWTPTVGFDFSF